jgi:hypothetical protein
MLLLRHNPVLLAYQLLYLHCAFTTARITSTDEDTTVFRFLTVPYWSILKVATKSIVDETTYVTMTHKFNATGHEQLEITDASTEYILKYSVTTPGTATITSDYTCRASGDALASCIGTKVTLRHDTQPMAAYTTMDLDSNRVLGHYLIAESIIIPWEHGRSSNSETLSTKPATTSKLKLILLCSYC